MTKSDVVEIIKSYDELIDRALDVVRPGGGFYASVDKKDIPRLSIDGNDNAILSWKEYESDYYGGGRITEVSVEFPAKMLWISHEQLRELQFRTVAEISEREKKVRAAQAAVERHRQEEYDLAEWSRLRAKYGPM